MQIKLLFFGESAGIPKTAFSLGLGLISVWIDGNGFTSASNDLGATGYLFLETRTIDIGEVDAEKQRIFTQLHGSVVSFSIKPNVFIATGGIARIAMSVAGSDNGSLVEHQLEFIADDCTGVSLVSGPVSFATTMLQMEQSVAVFEDSTIIPEDELMALADAAPVSQTMARTDTSAGLDART